MSFPRFDEPFLPCDDKRDPVVVPEGAGVRLPFGFSSWDEVAERESAARGPRAFAVLGVVLALCGAGLALARYLREPEPLVFAPSCATEGLNPVSEPYRMLTDWCEDGVPGTIPGVVLQVAPLPAPLATRDEVAALESRILALESRGAK